MSRPLPTVLPALVTPFTADGELDEAAHTHNVAVLADRGMDGFLLGGSTGEGPYLEPGERRSLLRVARDVAPTAHLMAGIAAETVRAGQEQLEEIGAAGADSALVLTPTTMTRGDAGAVVRFYRTLAAGSDLPLLLYSVPRWTAFELPEAAVHELATVSGIIGMKDSGGDIRRIARTAAAAPASFTLFNGASAVLGQAIWSGAHGGITASGNYVPELVQEVVAHRRLADQRRLAGVAATVERHGIPGVKAAARAIGLRPGYPRPPLAPLDPEAQTRVADLVPAGSG